MAAPSVRRPSALTATRVALGIVGLVVLGNALRLLLDLPTDDLVDALVWLVGGILLHDVVLAPLVVGLGWLAARLLPRGWRAPLAVGVVVWGTITIAVFPVLGEFGARSDNLTLLPRDYDLSWVLLTLLTGVVVAAFAVVRHLRARP